MARVFGNGFHVNNLPQSNCEKESKKETFFCDRENDKHFQSLCNIVNLQNLPVKNIDSELMKNVLEKFYEVDAVQYFDACEGGLDVCELVGVFGMFSMCGGSCGFRNDCKPCYFKFNKKRN